MNPRTKCKLIAVLIYIATLGASASAQLLPDRCWTHNVAEGKGFATALDACKHAVNIYQMNEYARIYPNNNFPGSKSCYAQQSANDNNPNDDFLVTSIHEMPIQPHCNEPACGPYGNIPDHYYTKVAVQTEQGNYVIHTAAMGLRRRGGEYTSAQRRKIINQNNITNGGVIVSDLLNAPAAFSEFAAGLPNPPCETLKYNPPNPPPGYRPVSTSDPCYVNIHHIIPRVDQNSCPCGRNSFRNALVISRQLNIKLSNTPRSPEFLNYVATIQAPECTPMAAPARVTETKPKARRAWRLGKG